MKESIVSDSTHRIVARVPILGLVLALVCAAAPAQNLLQSISGSPGDRVGSSVAPAGDVDRDGYDDFLVGAPEVGIEDFGRAYVRSGRTGLSLLTLDGQDNSDFGFSQRMIGDLDGDGLRDLLVGAPEQGSGGSVLVYSAVSGVLVGSASGAAGGNLGYCVAPLGDVNGDGIEEFLAANPTDDSGATNAGKVSVFDGATFAPTLTLLGATGQDQFGYSIDRVGDLDGDEIADFVVGAPFRDVGGSNAGNASVHSGRDGSVLFSLDGGSTGDQLGFAVAGIGDADGDGVGDLAIGAPYDGPFGAEGGVVRVYSGAAFSLLYTFVGASPGDRFGESVSGAGDVDGDGFSDIVVGAPGSDINGNAAGTAYVYSGKLGTLLYAVHGISAGDGFGSSVASAGDINRDGLDDVVVGAPSHNNFRGLARVYGLDSPFPPYCFCGFGPCVNDDVTGGCRNSTGEGATLRAVGTVSVSSDDLRLVVERIPAGEFGIVYMGGGGIQVPFGDGDRCVGAEPFSICRFPVRSTGSGTYAEGPGLVAYSEGLGGDCVIDAGETWHFQAWFRDPQGPCGSGFNLSHGVAVTFAP